MIAIIINSYEAFPTIIHHLYMHQYHIITIITILSFVVCYYTGEAFPKRTSCVFRLKEHWRQKKTLDSDDCSQADTAAGQKHDTFKSNGVLLL